jgi:HEAT repeat protein
MATRVQITKALAQIEHGSESEACEAAKLLSNVNGGRIIVALTRILRSGEKPYSRENAAYALAWHADRKAVSSLLMSASDADELDAVRAQAVEGLGMHLDSDRVRSRLARRAEDLMLELLESSSPTLRFWACFGLAALGSQRAVPRLRKLRRTDKSICPGWWYVHEEAEDALELIAGRAPRDRLPVHLRMQGKTEPDASPNRRPKPQAPVQRRRVQGAGPKQP